MKGERKIKNELDCISILTKLRYLDVLVSLFLNQEQKLLLGFQRRNVIQEDTGALSSDDEQEKTKDIIKKLNFNDPSASNILNEEKLDEALDLLGKKQALKPLDQKILLGIVSRAPNKYASQQMANSDSSSSSSSEGEHRSPPITPKKSRQTLKKAPESFDPNQSQAKLFCGTPSHSSSKKQLQPDVNSDLEATGDLQNNSIWYS